VSRERVRRAGGKRGDRSYKPKWGAGEGTGEGARHTQPALFWGKWGKHRASQDQGTRGVGGIDGSTEKGLWKELVGCSRPAEKGVGRLERAIPGVKGERGTAVSQSEEGKKREMEWVAVGCGLGRRLERSVDG